MSATLLNTWDTSNDNWVLGIECLDAAGSTFVTANSSGHLNLYDVNASDAISSIKIHESSINALNAISPQIIASCSSDGVKITDIRTQAVVNEFSNTSNSSFLSLAARDNLLAGGTELVGSDAELHIWDLRNPADPVKSYVDSHHDDITSVQFYPGKSHANYLMSGSTDGYVNIYDLKESDEDDALHQVINYSSVHTCRFITPSRIGILSHMETLSFHELNNTNYEVWDEPPANDYGDVRQKWGCEYVIDLNPKGYVSYGSNSTGELWVRPFVPSTETFAAEAISFPRAHGDEVVRDLKILNTNAWSCGEDGTVKMWSVPALQTYEWTDGDTESPDDHDNKDPEDNKDTKEKKKRDKKDKKHKKDRKEKKKKKDVRYKPY